MLIFGVLIVSLLIAGGYALAGLHYAALLTGSNRRRLRGTPADFGMRFREVRFLNADQLTLAGWLLESPGARATVVIVHNRDGNRSDSQHALLRLQTEYVMRGFNVFAFDLAGRGESSGRRDQLGDAERRDVRAAVAYAHRQTAALPIVVHGFGFGASLSLDVATTMQVVAAVIADSPIASMRDFLREHHRQIPPFLFPFTCWLSRRIYRSDVDALVPIDLMHRVKQPVLLIHAEGDPMVHPSHTLNLAAASLSPRTETWLLEGWAGHATYYRERPHAYIQRCLAFIDRALPMRLVAPGVPAGARPVPSAG